MARTSARHASYCLPPSLAVMSRTIFALLALVVADTQGFHLHDVALKSSRPSSAATMSAKWPKGGVNSIDDAVIKGRTAIAAAVLGLFVGTFVPSVAEAAYPLASVTDSTPYPISGEVKYASAFCSDDDYTANPGTKWFASSRGVCLITRVTATVQTPNGDKTAASYSSSGTSYSNFAVIDQGGNNFQVTRIVD